MARGVIEGVRSLLQVPQATANVGRAIFGVRPCPWTRAYFGSAALGGQWKTRRENPGEGITDP